MHLHHRCRDANAAEQTHQFVVAPDHSLQDKARAQGDRSATEPSPRTSFIAGPESLLNGKSLELRAFFLMSDMVPMTVMPTANTRGAGRRTGQ